MKTMRLWWICLVGMLIVSCSTESSFSKKDTVVIVVAHQDDETIGAGITIQQAIKAGAQVFVIMVTDGAPKEFGQGTEETAVRNNESVAALQLIGISANQIYFLGFDDLGFIFDQPAAEPVMKLQTVLESLHPTQVFVHAYEGGHIDHDASQVFTIEALQRMHYKGKLYEFNEYNAFGYGTPIPQNKSTLKKYRQFTVLTPTIEEIQRKKAMLRTYVSQNPDKSALAFSRNKTGLDFLSMALRVDNNPIAVADLHKQNPAMVRFASIDSAGVVHITAFGESFARNNNISILNQKENIDYALKSADAFVPYLYGCEKLPVGERQHLADEGKMLKCLEGEFTSDFACPNNEPPKVYRGVSYCTQSDVPAHASADNIYSTIDNTRALYGGTIPDYVQKKYRAGSYYMLINNSQDHFGGTITTEPDQTVYIAAEVGNFENTTLHNISVRFFTEGYLFVPDAQQTIQYDSLAAKNSVRVAFNFSVPTFANEFYYNINAEMTGTNEKGELLSSTMFFTLHVVQKNYSLKITQVGPGELFVANGIAFETQKGFEIGVTNKGLQNSDFQLKVNVPGIQFTKLLPQNCSNENTAPAGTISCSDYIVSPASTQYNRVALPKNISAGDYSFSIDIWNNNQLMDEYKGTLFVDANGTITIAQKVLYTELGFVAQQLNSPLSFEKCTDDDYMICRFYWPDNVRQRTSYDYCEKPSIVPPDIAYENQIEQILHKTFGDMVEIIKSLNNKSLCANQ